MLDQYFGLTGLSVHLGDASEARVRIIKLREDDPQDDRFMLKVEIGTGGLFQDTVLTLYGTYDQLVATRQSFYASLGEVFAQRPVEGANA